MNKYIFALILGTILFISCSQPKADFIGEWSLDYMEFEGKILNGSDMGEPTYRFDKDGTYEIKVQTSIQEGRWLFDEKTLVLTNNDNPNYAGNALIRTANDSVFIYTIFGEGETATTVFLKK